MGNATVGTQFVSPQVSFTITDGGVDFIVGDNFVITLTEVSPAATPYYAIPWSTATADYWVWTSNTAAYRWDGTQHEVVTRTSGGAYTATEAVQWTGCVSGDVVILNNSVDLPQYMGTSGTDFENFPTGGSDWPSALRCKSIRSYKNYLVAINLTEGASSRPQNVRWSTAADPGSLPMWDITDPTLEAGESALAESDGAVVDGLSLGDSFIIYKEDSVYGMQLVGGQFVMNFYSIFPDDGIMSQNCVAAFQGQHFVVSPSDVYVHNGSTKKSVVSGTVREALFNDINMDYSNRAFCVADPRHREVLFCYVPTSSTVTLPTRAFVWNWENGAVSVRDLPTTAYCSFGKITRSSTASVWDSDSGLWDSDFATWSDASNSTPVGRLVILDTANSKFYAEGDYDTDDGTNFSSYVQRTGIEAGDGSVIKYVSRIYPKAAGTGSLYFYVGASDSPNGTYAWEGPYTYTIGTSRKIDCRVSGRYLGIIAGSTTGGLWQLSSYIIEGEGVGDGRSA
jgi:hypothetical protein